jgi:ribosomal protein L11 methyltransferase
VRLGVLAIAAARLGFGEVVALDFDPLAVEATEVNARVNGVQLAEVRRWDLRDEAVPAAPTVVANLLLPLLRDLRLAEEAPDELIVSGILTHQAEEAAAAFAARGLFEAERRSAGEWSALLLRR